MRRLLALICRRRRHIWIRSLRGATCARCGKLLRPKAPK